MDFRSWIRRWAASLLVAGYLVFAGNAISQDTQPKAIDSQQVLTFLNQTVGWYRHLAVEQQLATETNDVVFFQDDRQLANQIVRLSFDFARAEAEVLAKGVESGRPSGTGQPGGSYQSLLDLASRSDKQVKQAQDEIGATQKKLDAASGRRREELRSEIAEVQSELDLAQTRRDVIDNMLQFVGGANATGAGADGLRSQIAELEKAVPAAAAENSQGQSTSSGDRPAETAVTVSRKPEPSGILALITDLIGLSKKINALDDSIKQTEAFQQSSKDLRSPLGAQLREMTQRGDQIAGQPDSSDPATLAHQKQELDELTAQFKPLSEVVLPLAKQGILFDLYKRSLINWRTAVADQHTTELKSLIIRLSLLVVVLVLVMSGSELWRKAIFRYVQDPRRRYQLLLFRRVVVWFLVAIILVFSFATELGSLATFAGLMTAGVAVALQNVLLSVAGYFFLIGKYGLRVGDRVQISGVTGEVVEVGLVRFHIMELGSASTDAQPTGRVVAFSNSAVFQPTGGIFKQIPGTSFVWHEITLTLVAGADYHAVEERLVAAVDKVFSEYREEMDGQRRRLEKNLSPISTHTLRPQSRLHLTQGGLEVVIRYPVGLEDAALIDDHITRELLDTINREPKLKMVGSGIPNIQPVVEEMASSNA